MDTSLIRSTIAGTCAVCVIAAPPEEYARDPDRRSLHIVGSGFLVRPTTAITNRHVVQTLQALQAAWNLKDEQFYLCFVYPGEKGWQEAYCRVKKHGLVVNEELDIALIDFVRRPEPHFGACQPLPVAEACVPNIGDPIGVCGYPYGEDALRSFGGRINRMGPVFQQGFVAALAPFNFVTQDEVREIVLDVRTAGGMSGAPVFRTTDGIVVGVHGAGIEATLAHAIPIDRKRLDAWLVAHDSARS